jgi:hypothetical protein
VSAVQPRTRFALIALVLSVALFAAWSPLGEFLNAVVTSLAGAIRGEVSTGPARAAGPFSPVALVPAIAAILAAEAVSWRRRLSAVGLAIGCFLVLEIALTAAGLRALVDGTGGELTAAVAVATAIDYTLVWGFSLTAVLLFTRGNLGMLWEPEPVRAAAGGWSDKRCPICGQHKAGLAAHIQAAHGTAALRDPRVRRALGG